MSLTEGFVDTNVFLHAQSHDEHSRWCRELLRCAANGTLSLAIDPIVLHELTYVLPRYVQQMGRRDVALYLRTVVAWPGIVLHDEPFWLSVLDTWESDGRLSWADAVLIRRAQAAERPVWTRNHRDFARYSLAPAAWPEP